jgi:long-chain fatty acid transport protein
MGFQRFSRLSGSVAVVAIGLAAAQPAFATDGYNQEGFSAREKALGGAGAADPADAMTIANNPAGLAAIGSQLNIGFGWFRPDLTYSASGTTLVAPGSVKSEKSDFPLPYGSYSQQIDATSAWGVAVYANGGFGTTYTTRAAAPFCALVGPFAFGVYCGGSNTGITLDQAIISPAYAKQFGSVSIGIAPMIAVQMFQAFGLGPFAAFSGSPGNVSERGNDYTIGIGVRFGIEWRATDQLRLAATAATPDWSTRFSRYSGLFANHGQLNAPGQVGAGVAYDLLPSLTAMVDYKRIFFGGQASIGNSATNLGIVPLGAPNGPGFGWRDINIVAIGAEWRVTPAFKLRAGFNWCDNPITAPNVTFNILAPAVITHQYTAGFAYTINNQSTVEFSALVAPKAFLSGPEVLFAGAPTPGSKITLSAEEFEATLGYTYRFASAPSTVIVAKY